MPKVSEGFRRTALEAAQKNGDQSGQVFLVSGAYSGIGVETCKALLSVKGKVILAGRNPDAMKTFVAELLEQDKFDSALIDGDGPPLDLGDLASVKTFAEYVLTKNSGNKLTLILNAGVMMTPKGTTKDGFETQVGTNVVGHYLLAKKLESITQRQVWVSSYAHQIGGGGRFDFDYNFKKPFEDTKEKKYSALVQYQQSKLGNILLAKEFPKRIPEIEAVSLHPGVIDTNLGRHLNGFIKVVISVLAIIGAVERKKTTKQGAATTVTCATMPTESLQIGAYYQDCEVAEEAECAKNMDDAKKLYDQCDDVTKAFQ